MLHSFLIKQELLSINQSCEGEYTTFGICN